MARSQTRHSTISGNPLDIKIKHEHEFINGNTCIVCSTKLGGFGKKKCFCKFCGNPVCEKHSQKRKKRNGMEHRCCNTCDRNMIENKLRAKYSLEIERLQQVRNKFESRLLDTTRD